MGSTQAGAKHVYGIDMSAIAEQAKQIVAENGYGDRVTIIRGKVEEVSLPVDKVDIIISEWMVRSILLLKFQMLLHALYHMKSNYCGKGNHNCELLVE